MGRKVIAFAAIIIMITAAGGSFGLILRDSGIADVLGSLLSKVNLGIFLPFLITAALKSAQDLQRWLHHYNRFNYSTVNRHFGFDTPLELALAVSSLCAGAMVVSHVNDSFFWVITQMTNMSIKTGYKLHTLGTLICGLTSMFTIWIIYTIFC